MKSESEQPSDAWTALESAPVELFVSSRISTVANSQTAHRDRDMRHSADQSWETGFLEIKGGSAGFLVTPACQKGATEERRLAGAAPRSERLEESGLQELSQLRSRPKLRNRVQFLEC